MKQIRIFAVLLIAMCLVLPFASFADEHSSRHGEIRVVNDTDTQVSFIISTERHSRLSYSLKPDANTYLLVDGVRLRVSGRDTVQLGDWGRSEIRDLARFYDGVWNLNIRHARRELRDQRR